MLIKNSAPIHLPQAAPKQEQAKNRTPSIKPRIKQLPPLPPRPVSFAHRIKISPQKIQPPKIQIPPQQPTAQPMQGRIFLGKVAQFLRDPSVLSVECTGPAKHLLVNRSGTIQTTPVTLTKQETDQILGEISAQTQIPIVPGLFKALYKNLLITAVVSDYVGTRFIIQKRTPF